MKGVAGTDGLHRYWLRGGVRHCGPYRATELGNVRADSNHRGLFCSLPVVPVMARRCECLGFDPICPDCNGSGWRDDKVAERVISAALLIGSILIFAAGIIYSWYKNGSY